MQTEKPSILRFGAFRVDLAQREVLKHGTRIRLSGQAFLVLERLLSEPGQPVSRDELRRMLWPEGTFVDFEHSLNAVMNRLRSQLNDSAEEQHYIETLPGLGYKFVGSVQGVLSRNGNVPSNQPGIANEVAPQAITVSGNREHTKRRSFIGLLSAAVGCALLIAALTWFIWGWITKDRWGSREPAINAIAVLPLTNLARDSGDDYFADGMTEELITELARLSSVRVISRTSIMRYKQPVRSLPEIGGELNVDAVVEGTVRRSGDRVRISVQLVRISPERHLWADAFEGDIRDVLSLQRDVAHDIVGQIHTKLAARQQASRNSDKPVDPDAYENYLRGRYFLARRNAEAMNKAVGYFQQAVQRSPQYAKAYAGLAVTYDLLATYELLPPSDSFPKAKQFASQALALDNTLSEAYTARASAASFWEFDWATAERDFQRAIALEPSSALAHHWYGEHFINIGKAERAVSELKRARELDPLSLPINSTLGRVYRDAGRYSEAVDQCRKTLDLDPHFSMAHWCLGQVHIGERRYAAAIPELERATALGTTPILMRDLAYTYAAVGKKMEARAILESLMRKAQSTYIPPYSIAVVHAALGEKDAAFQWLERAYRERDAQITDLVLGPEVDSLRSDPRFAQLIQRLNLPK